MEIFVLKGKKKTPDLKKKQTKKPIIIQSVNHTGKNNALKGK